jgi:hypothetical protein
MRQVRKVFVQPYLHDWFSPAFEGPGAFTRDAAIAGNE